MAHVSGSVFREIREGSVLRLPIRGRMKPFFITITTMTCFDFFNSLVYAATRGASGPIITISAILLKIQSLFYLRMSQNGFNFGTEHESAVAMGIKSGFTPMGSRAKITVFSRFPHSKEKIPLHNSKRLLPIAQKHETKLRYRNDRKIYGAISSDVHEFPRYYTIPPL